MNRRLLHSCLPPAACAIACLLAAMAAGSAVAASEPSTATADASIVGPLIGETTALVVKIDPARLSLPDLPQILKSAVPGIEEAYRRGTAEATARIETLREATGGEPVYGTIGIPLSKTELSVFFFVRETEAVNQKALRDRLGKQLPGINLCTRAGLVVASPDEKLNLAAALERITPSAREGLEEAFQAVSGYPVQVLLFPPDYVRRTVVELMPELPRQLGGGPSSVLTEGLVWAAFGLDPAKLRAEIVVQSASAEAAGRLAAHLPKMLGGFYESAPEGERPIPRESFKSLVSLLGTKVEGDRVVVRINKAE